MPTTKRGNKKQTGRAICLVCNREFTAKSLRARDEAVRLHNKAAHPGEEMAIVRAAVQLNGNNNNNPNLVHAPQMNAHQNLHRAALELNQLQ